MQTKATIFWMILFALVIGLSQDYLFVEWASDLVYLGFPSWLGWFVLVHILFLIVLYFFSKKYWRE